MYVFTMKITIYSIKIYQVFKETIMVKYYLFYEEEKTVICNFCAFMYAARKLN